MEYRLKVNADEVTVDCQEQQTEGFAMNIADCSYSVRYIPVTANSIHLIVEKDGAVQTLNAYLANGSGGKMISLNGTHFEICDAETGKFQKRKNGLNVLPDKVTPPMPAVVVAINVNAGDVVTKNQEVVVLSAMKMETTLVAPYDGTVTAVNAAAGDKVSPGDILVEIEKGA